MTRRLRFLSDDWLTRASLLGSVLLALTGTAVLVGWVLQIDPLVRLSPDNAPMSPNTALSLLALGLVLLALEWKADWVAWLAVVPVAIGLLTLGQYLTGRDLQVDEWLLHVHLTADPAAPGRMAPVCALAVVAASLALLWRSLPFPLRWRQPVVALAASVIIPAGLGPLLGSLAGLSAALVWSQTVLPAPHIAWALLLLGALLLSRAWRDDPDRGSGMPAWLPVPVVAATVLLTLLLTATLQNRELEFVRATTRLTINNAATALKVELDDETMALQRMAAHWTQIDQPGEALRDRDGEAYRNDYPALRSLALVDPTRRTRWAFPKQGNEYLLEYDHGRDPAHRQLLEQLQRTGRPVSSPLLPLALGGRGFLIAVPVPTADPAAPQILMAEFLYPVLLARVESRLRLFPHYAVAIEVDDQPVFERSVPDATAHSLREESTFRLYNQRIQISLTPSAATLEANRTLFPGLITGLGLGLSGLLGVVVHLARSTLLRRRAAEKANTRLIAENEERRRAEEALRASQAATRKLSLVASSTQNPVAITDAAGRVEWANESFTRLLGLTLPQVLGQPVSQLLASPGTDPATVSQLGQALQRAVPLKADLLYVARDARRFHLDFDLQPVGDGANAAANFIILFTDITARVETEQHLRRAKEEADAASRAKSEFLASMSHEIRTPMNGVIGMTSLLLETPLTVEQRDCVNTIRTSGDALLGVINAILDLSKIESGGMELEEHPLELAVCLEQALDLFAVEAAAKQIELAFVIAPQVPDWIIGDATRLRQIVINLVNNAVKFTPHGFISVEVALAPPGAEADPAPGAANSCVLEFAVRDTGIGIPSAKQHLLFKPFSQIDASTTRRYGGTGLGLVICQRLCKSMGGDIRVESAPDRGSVFVFTIRCRVASLPDAPTEWRPPSKLRGSPVLIVDDFEVSRRAIVAPLKRAGLPCLAAESCQAARDAGGTGPPPALLVIDQVLPDGEGRLLALELRQRWQQPRLPLVLLLPAGFVMPDAWRTELAPVAPQAKPIKAALLRSTIRTLYSPVTTPPIARPVERRKLSEDIPLAILVVEDNPVNQNVALTLLGRLGYQADVASNGQEGIDAFNQRDYDLVLMDLQMPIMDGLDATRELRRRPPPARQPCIIAFTANALMGDRETCLAAGMDDYLTKPLKLEVLADTIRRNLANRASR